MIEAYSGAGRLDILRERINDENYLHAAIQRLALVLSKELMDITASKMQHQRCNIKNARQGYNGRQRKGQK